MGVSIDLFAHFYSVYRAPKIIPYGNLSIPPGATALHYGIEVIPRAGEILTSVVLRRNERIHR